MANFDDVVRIRLVSMVGGTEMYGDEAELIMRSASYNTWGFSGASASRLAATGHADATSLGIALDTLIGDLIKRGILIQTS